jgi:flagellar motor switch protein FliM
MDRDEVLSEAEVEALMEGADAGDGDGHKAGTTAPDEIYDYDFTGREHIVRGRMPVLDLVNERFAQRFQQALHNKLQRTAEISAEPLRTVKYAEYVNSLGVSASLSRVSMRQLKGNAMVVLEAGLVGTIVDLFFGGTGQCEEVTEAREFSATEQRVIQLLLEQLVIDLQAAWAAVMTIDFEHLETGIDLQFTSIAGANDPLVVCAFQVGMDETNGTFHIALPLAVLEPITDLLDGGLHKEQSGSEQFLLRQLKKNLQRASVEVHATLLETELRLRDVLDLKAGDVIPVKIPDQVTLLAEGVPMFRGRFGIHNDKNAVKVTMRMEDPDNSQGDQ